MKTLTGMTDFVLEQINENKISSIEFSRKAYNHATFLKQTPTLGDFVPCDEDGNVLEEPCYYGKWRELGSGVFSQYSISIIEECKKYQQALSKVIFKGFTYNFEIEHCGNGSVNFHKEFLEGKTIEDLVPYNLEMV